MHKEKENLEIKTTVQRNPEDNKVLQFKVIAEVESELDEETLIAANLTGFIVRPFMWDIESFHDIFDSDTQHGFECWDILTKHSEKIENVLLFAKHYETNCKN